MMKKENEGILTNVEKIDAISWAAGKRDTTYGQLMSALLPSEKEEIYLQYREYKKSKVRNDENEQ